MFEAGKNTVQSVDKKASTHGYNILTTIDILILYLAQRPFGHFASKNMNCYDELQNDK